MNKLNKEWAELEGWIYRGPKCDPDNGPKMWVQPNNGPAWKALPDFTEPNRFFSEVVPRMEKLLWELYVNGNDVGWETKIKPYINKHNYLTSSKIITSAWSDDFCEAGLEAAIKARKELKDG